MGGCAWGRGRKKERDGGREGRREESMAISYSLSLVQFVYVSVRGLALRNTFTIIIWDMIFNEDQYTVDVPEGVRDTQIFNLVDELKITNVT